MLGTPPQVCKLEKECNVEPYKITRTGQPYRVLRRDRQLSLLTESPHFCPRCITGFNCEDEPCMKAYEPLLQILSGGRSTGKTDQQRSASVRRWSDDATRQTR